MFSKKFPKSAQQLHTVVSNFDKGLWNEPKNLTIKIFPLFCHWERFLMKLTNHKIISYTIYRQKSNKFFLHIFPILRALWIQNNLLRGSLVKSGAVYSVPFFEEKNPSKQSQKVSTIYMHYFFEHKYSKKTFFFG